MFARSVDKDKEIQLALLELKYTVVVHLVIISHSLV